eukprot:626871_1
MLTRSQLRRPTVRLCRLGTALFLKIMLCSRKVFVVVMPSNYSLYGDRKKALYYGASLLAVGVSAFCLYRLHGIRNRRNIINLYRSNRRMINVGIRNNNTPSIRVMSYNILADGNRYALNSDMNYTPLKYRKWNHRMKRILAQIEAHQPDIVGIQETTYKTYHNSLQIEFDLMGYESVHAIRDREGHKNGFDRTTDTIIYKKDKFELLNKKIIRFNEECDLDKYDTMFGAKGSHFRSKTLKKFPDVLIALHLQCGSQQFIVSSTHLYWNPRQPQIKLAQALMINESLNEVCNEWGVDVDEIPMICCGDFNALPIKTKADRYDPFLEEGDCMVSGVYQLMTEQHVECTHQDHPKRRLYEKIYRSIYYQQNENNTMDIDGSAVENCKTDDEVIAEKRAIDIEELARTVTDSDKYPQLMQLEYIDALVDYKTSIRWKSVYRTAAEEPVWTNHVPRFSGTIDYIFCNDNVRVLSYLEHPAQNNLSYHKIDLQQMINIESVKDDHDLIKLEKQKEIQNGETFAFMPNELYPSDHLCLIADLEFMPKKQEIQRLVDTLQS